MDHEGCSPPEILLAFSRGELAESDVHAGAGPIESCSSCSEALARFDNAPDTFLLDLRRWLAGSRRTSTHLGDESQTVAPPSSGFAPDRLDAYRIVREVGRGDAGVDIDGLAITLYELACGVPAFPTARRPTRGGTPRRTACSGARPHG